MAPRLSATPPSTRSLEGVDEDHEPFPIPMTRTAKPARLAAALFLFLAAACNTTPDKRLLQYLNTAGFGNRCMG